MLSIRKSSDRLDALSRVGCVVCRLAHGAFVQNEIQHLTVGGRRMGDRFTIPLCPWHHRAVPPNGLTPAYTESIYGPSFAKSRERFEQAFGHDIELLEETDKWLGVAEPSKWYQELRAGWHHSHALPSSTVTSSASSTTMESPQLDEQSKTGSENSSEASSDPQPTKSRRSSPGSSKRARSPKPTSTS